MQALYQLSYAPRGSAKPSTHALVRPVPAPRDTFPTMGFKGWPADALEFYEGLEADNSKVYWTEHKDVYTQSVHAPMAALLADLAGEFGEGRIFRPYRDVRFSADKTPYKTSIAAEIGSGYVQLSADGLLTGAGMYHLAPDQLERYRRAVDHASSGPALQEVIEVLSRAKLDVHGSDALKTAPKGYPRDHPRIDLLRYRGLVAMKQWQVAAWLGTAATKTRIVEVLRAARPLCGWLDEHVGSSTMEAPARRR
jgi:uncharacterized protein (TIGR02453 family)